jgi:3-isopropylmalate dehydrogenase
LETQRRHSEGSAVTYRLGVLAGDGIGPEIVEATLRLLEAVRQGDSHLRFEWVPLPIGWEALRKNGSAIPEFTVEMLAGCDAWIMGFHDSASYPTAEREKRNPSGELRHRFDLYANIRPARAYAGLPAASPRTDLVVVRENTEGFYSDRIMAWGVGQLVPTPDVLLAVGKFTRRAAERIARTAFPLTPAELDSGPVYRFNLNHDEVELCGAVSRAGGGGAVLRARCCQGDQNHHTAPLCAM